MILIKLNPSRTRRKLFKAVAFVVLIFVLVGAYFLVRKYQKRQIQEQALEQIAAVPSPKAEYSIQNTEYSQTPNMTQETIPSELNLNVPFTPQAPEAIWDHTHEEACEEASILMADRYFQKKEISGPDDAEQGIQEIISWENEHLGFFESTTAAETVRIIRETTSLEAEIETDPTINEIKQAINENKLVLVPAAGRELNNPFYKQPGPLYHMLVIKGYTETQFITNDPGTKRGENYPYNFETLLSANHDWNGGDVSNGSKQMIFISN